MKISYNWLKNYFDSGLPVAEAAALLTGGGLEVEHIEKQERIPGGLEGLVVGEVKTREKHPDADRLSICTVDVGGPAILQIVCGAANVATGQKVVVAVEGAKLYPTTGEPFVIKKSKIRGQASEGMICAEDEIGLGASHAGIMVLDQDARIGMPAKEYFKLEADDVMEIGLTPNRADAASHTGVARDLVALVNCRKKGSGRLVLPSVDAFKVDDHSLPIAVKVEAPQACIRYSGVTIKGIKVQESPAWLKQRLESIGLRPINNVVDVTNFVLHECGQPLHAFDAARIKGATVLVKTCPDKTPFVTLDGQTRELSSEDLMICNISEPMCIAGVFGGIGSGVTNETTSLFLESACFSPVSIRKTSKRHELKTDASFRFERGTDPDITVYALKRAALLILEIAGGTVSSDLIDIYPTPVLPFVVPFAYENGDRLIGKKIEREIIRDILVSLDITIESESKDTLLLQVPPRKVDVTRECDVVEEILRIYGYNEVEVPGSLHASVSYTSKPDKVKIKDTASSLLSDKGFSEIICNSLTRGAYYEQNEFFKAEQSVVLLNPLSADLNVMRQSLLYGGLEVIAYNQNRKQNNLCIYEFGKTYLKSANGYFEQEHLALFLCGEKAENKNHPLGNSGFYVLKGYVMALLTRLGITVSSVKEFSDEMYSSALQLQCGKKKMGTVGMLKKTVLKQTDVGVAVYYADLDWDAIISLIPEKDTQYKEVPKFPAVKRDLALILDKKIRFAEVEQLAYQVEKQYLKELSLFDVYEGDKIGKEHKSYAISFLFQDDEATLQDKQIEKIMEKMMKTYTDKLGATIRQ
ncbi:MAG TPA: phenylalanine--tRNA ligase subunit beta [Bacteroidia bacterium]|jgi:phenylalanyl-tRNA synthetase beta chain|nr:phenylalanine--tRNA ligase subunit beta [Bacteroidia bacterium]